MSTESTESNKIKENRRAESQLRHASTCSYYYTDVNEPNNNDVLAIPNFRACYSKSLIHSEDGQVDSDEIHKMLNGILQCHCYLNKINYPGQLRLNNPSAIWSFDTVGPFKSSIPLKSPPSICSVEAAVEMIELYQMVLFRDTPFYQYNDRILFRGTSRGDLIGPYISQFLYLPFSYGSFNLEQRYPGYPPNQDFMTTWKNWLSVQNGKVEEVLPERVNPRYILTLRDLATYLHLDDTLLPGLNTALILNKLKCPSNKGIPYNQKVKENALVDLGKLDLYDLMCRTVRCSMLACWYNKWNYLRVPPEVLAAEIQRSTLNISPEVLDSPVLKEIYQKQGNYLLAQAYPEGSPTHPAYPSGHAVSIGATTTILKAFYNENFEFEAMAPNEDGSELVSLGYRVRVGDELDKLASNIAFGRSGAGVNYRSDNEAGIWLGEQVAIDLLKKEVFRYTQDITFNFHTRNGKLVEITNV